MMEERSTLSQDISNKSEFLKTVRDFAIYVNKEYINESSGGMSLFMCASDATLEDGRVASSETRLGNRSLVVKTLADMMDEDKFKDDFRAARAIACDVGFDKEIFNTLRRNIRQAYFWTIPLVLWTVVVICLYLLGVSNIVTMVSNLLLMAYVGYLHYIRIVEMRRRLNYLKEEMLTDARAKMQAALDSLFEEMKTRLQNEDED